MFYLAALCFPFSVAATNIALGGALAVGIGSGAWWHGVRRLWREQRRLAVALPAYLLLVAIGLVWSSDRAWGLHILGRHWFWLLIPVGVYALAERTWRSRFLIALSLGLSLHLVFCVLQKFGYVTGTDAGGSNAVDATGHIGHIGFGFVYGVWAAWLLHWGWMHHGWRRYGAWLLAAWAWIMIFLAQGRSGYLIAFVTFVVVLWKHLAGNWHWHRIGEAATILLLIASALALGPGKERLQGTWRALDLGYQNKAEYNASFGVEKSVRDTQSRLAMWQAAWEVWQAHPILGVGTGGFPVASEQVRNLQPALDFGSQARASHPHNAYLLSLARWGWLGLAAMCWLLYEWIRLGWRQDWLAAPSAPLAVLSGIALAIHGLTSNSLEEHFSAVYAVLLLSLALAEISAEAVKD